jgi:hypothetical protein
MVKWWKARVWIPNGERPLECVDIDVNALAEWVARLLANGATSAEIGPY